MKILPFIQSEDALSPRFNQSISRSQSAAVLSDSLMWRRRCDDESKNYYCENPMRAAAAAEAASAGEASAFSLIFIMVARDDSSWMT
jgi:hypothetical protein